MAVPAHSTKRITRFPFFGLALIALLSVAVSPVICAQQQLDLDAPASEMATAIFRSSKGVLVSTKVLVIDFAGAHEAPTELGEKLADAFSDSLSKNAHGFVVMDRTEYLRSLPQTSSLQTRTTVLRR